MIKSIPRIMLAPMQGVLDPFMRKLLTAYNDYDLCVSEFVRVVDQRLPKKTFYRLAPELLQGGLTDSGTPIRVQLLGQYPQWLAENAQLAIELGSYGIDFNCGCPSKTVNGSHGGGAALLKDPELIYCATKAIREAVPKAQPVSVKMRLGWDCASQCFEIADAIQQAGADEITVHGRTKQDGYRAERINWQAIGQIQQRLNIPVIANGEILDFNSAQKCREITACCGLMIGRGALNTPNLSKVIKYNVAKMAWSEVLQLLYEYVNMPNERDSGFYHVARIKQWLHYLDKAYPEAVDLFQIVKTEHSYDGVKAHIEKAVGRNEKTNFQ
ncbi:tRNA-dihydrouridine synthase C [[Haemophilus] ducreyi]|uniref:tRNA dihydrouridine(16) synthase DusC n=1 Tax=Haemophilus ducreyi TaxID=730 RepID=UPI000655D625|nr:tRNA dihydrouridine(16) synthase DusC [[Haemophilus] ducreyi]AKO38643.1 tRNA-dihydrouridine synthase C [[Haemophilus] ducreyi]AKO43094.1 tRNA-dihydrouridine synthase C [[Haemophilus] ducreyi]